MATIQLVKHTENVTETKITQRQSLETVQTMLHGGLSTVTYLRSLFPVKAYEKQAYEMDCNTILPYEDYALGNVPSRVEAPSQLRTNMRVLRRGRSKRVDKFLDWLENGAFPALTAGNLRSLHIYVHADRSCREKVLETYAFNITYLPQRDNNHTLADTRLDQPLHSLVNVEATNDALQHVLRHTIALCCGLPDLPSKRYLSMELFYIEDAAIANGPKGFVANDDPSQLLYPDVSQWEVVDRTTGSVDSGFHRSSMQVSHLQPVDYILPENVPTDEEAGWRPPQMPEISTSSSRWANNDVSDGETIDYLDEAPVISPGYVNLSLEAAATTPSTVIEADDSDDDGVSNRPSLSEACSYTVLTSSKPYTVNRGNEDVAPPASSIPKFAGGSQNVSSHIGDLSDSQSSDVPRMLKSFKAMMQAEYLTQGDTQTQSFPTPSNAIGHGGTGNKLARQNQTWYPALSQSTVTALEKGKTKLREKAQVLAKAGSIGKPDEEQLVLCQCGHSEEEGDMVQCTYCDTWQHLHCYGYTGAHDQRLPNRHVCYACLLGKAEEQTLAKLKELTLKRRAAHHALTQGLRTQKELARAMRVHSTTARDVFNFLKDEGYVREATGSHVSGYAATGKPKFVAVTEGPVREKMISELFDPLLHISHHYAGPGGSRVRQPTWSTQQLLASKSQSMPPPTTPATRLRKQATQSPPSGLDLPKSVTPYHTPFRFPTQHRPRHKRPLQNEIDHNEAISTTALPSNASLLPSPSKRIKSVRTEFVIKADGLSSSPEVGHGGSRS